MQTELVRKRQPNHSEPDGRLPLGEAESENFAEWLRCFCLFSFVLQLRGCLSGSSNKRETTCICTPACYPPFSGVTGHRGLLVREADQDRTRKLRHFP